MKSKLKGIAKLIRFDKPIGTFLLLWPTLSAFFILTNGHPSIILITIFCLGTFFMRSAGCVINDYFDRDIDGKVARTKDRPLITGEIKPKEALLLFIVLLMLSASLLIWTNKLTVIVALLGAGLTILYPLSKRFFQIPQVFLGLAFSWGVLMASAAELNQITISSVIIFSACFFWIMAYDTAYSMSDKEDDLSLNIYSSALTFGKYVKTIFLLCQIISLSLWGLSGYLESLGSTFFFSLLLVLVFVYHQYSLIKDYDRDKCFRAFRNNNWVGIAVFVGSVLGTL